MFEQGISKNKTMIDDLKLQNVTVTPDSKIEGILSNGIATGSTVFGAKHDDSTDIDIVYPCKDVKAMFDSIIKKDNWGYSGEYKDEHWETMSIYCYTADGKLYNVILAEEDLFEDWKYATERMLKDIDESEYYKCYYSDKINRILQFNVYKALHAFMRTGIPF